ncbi:MAG TPA: magnesium chelatase subunit D [Rubrivivax sp.]
MNSFDGAGDAAHAAALFAVDPAGLGGILLQAAAGPAREGWTAYLQSLLGQRPLKRMPLQIADDRLLGGLDLAATLNAGRPVVQHGLLAACDGGVLLLPMAERLPAGTAARLTLALDQQAVAVEREGLTLRLPTRLGVVAFDESVSDDEAVSAPLCDRLALHVRLLERRPDPASIAAWTFDDVEAARVSLAQVIAPDEVLQALCAAAQALGVFSMRAPLLALRVARAAAALAGREVADEDDARLAARMVLGPRATTQPPNQEPAEEPEPPPAPDPPEPSSEADDPSNPLPDQPLDDRVLDAAKAAIPPGLLLALAAGHAARARTTWGGRSGALHASPRRGRPVGVRAGDPAAGARLNLLATFRAAAPWQRMRRSERPGAVGVQVRRSDFHVTRFQQRSETTTLFAVDASGSAALHRLAEAKGAVELLLADCYVRRDRVALIAFRGKGAELLLPPTRSLVRAKRSLAGLPGGGGTPLAAGIEAATALVLQVQRRGDTAVVVLLTDGRANVARDGQPGRDHAQQDALAAARQWRLTGATALLLDTSPQPAPQAQAVAEAMGATYLPLPHADAAMLSQAVRLAAG